MKHLKRLISKLRALWAIILRHISYQCGGNITGLNITLAFTGLVAAAFLVVACVFLIAVIYVPYC